jgi:hypothetical protein
MPTAVADDTGVSRFNIARRNRATSHLDGFGTTQTGGIRITELVPTVTLDWLAERFPAPGVIKIDVEGAESKVLAGGAAVLRSRPTIICEVADTNSVALGELLANHGYTVYDGHQFGDQRTPLTAAPWNTLAIATSAPDVA